MSTIGRESQITYFAVGDTGAHDGHVTSRIGPAFPSPGGWTEQEVTGAHGTVLGVFTEWEPGPMGRSPQRQAEDALNEWLKCPGKGYCYTHRPGAR